jgi:hypothetical protein
VVLKDRIRQFVQARKGGAAIAGGSAVGPRSGSAGPDRLGLSLGHNSSLSLFSEEKDETPTPEEWAPLDLEEAPAAKPGQFVIRIAEGGAACRVSEVAGSKPAPPPGAKRGQVQGFSRSSRLRMLEWVNTIDREQIRSIFFVTMTVTRGTADWQQIEQYRKKHELRFRRKWGHLRYFIIWKKELHKSGTPHLHYLVFWLDREPHLVQEFRPWNDGAWAESVGGEHVEQHRKTACSSEMMQSWNGVASYTTKYLSKDQEGVFGDTGRIWGIVNRRHVPCRVREQIVDAEVGRRVRRTLRKLQARKRRYWQAHDGDRWYTLRPFRLFKGGRRVSVEEQVGQARVSGRRLRLVKPTSLRRRHVTVWGVEEGGWRAEPIGSEVHSYASSLHFVRAADVVKLVEFYARGSGEIPF